jgi:predicted NUDIX family phosphoesterase
MKEDELVLCVTSESVSEFLVTSARYTTWDELNRLFSIPFNFVPRRICENETSLKQVIPYTITYLGDKIVSYVRKNGGEERLNNFHSIGIGGHIRDSDANDNMDFFITTYQGALREHHEELNLFHSTRSLFPVGIVYDDRNDVGRVHLGIIFNCIVSGNSIQKREDEVSDIVLNSTYDLIGNKSKHEGWSQLCIESLF